MFFQFSEGQLNEWENTIDDKRTTYFENVEYKGLYDLNNPFTVTSKKAQILTTDPDIVHMFDMDVVLYNIRENKPGQMQRFFFCCSCFESLLCRYNVKKRG